MNITHADHAADNHACSGARRFKIMPRVVNVEEWAVKAPLSMSEHKLLVNYNGKPIMTRPQHLFFHGHNYMEVGAMSAGMSQV